MINFKNIKQLFILLLVAILFFSCQKSFDSQEQPAVIILPSDITSTVVASTVSGFVTDVNNAAVKDASVLIGTNTTVTTDKYGYFEARNVTVVKNAALVSVSKAGFFKGIKTFIATQNKGAFFRIKLIPKVSSGTFIGASGGAVTLSSGLTVSLPANAVVNAANNATYAGVVTVSAFYINPTASDINSIMPGDLRGLDTDNQLKLLTSYGMAAVELTGSAGELLQIASGKKATLTMPIPTTLLTTAPTTLPLWYFNESNGLWKQEGTATKNGNVFIGEVSHFSFWNCDVPNNYVQFNCTVVNTAGQTVQNAFVKISLVSNPLIAAYGYTDSTGYVNGAVPNDAQLKLEVFGNSSCGTAAFSQTFTTTNVNVAYGNVTINTTTYIATLVGSVKNCSGAPVTNGYIIIQDGNFYSRSLLSNTGSFSINNLVCSFPKTISIIGEDITNTQQSLPTSYVITNSGVNNISNINACGTTTQQFINYSINGTNYGFTSPVDSFFYGNIQQVIINIQAFNPNIFNTVVGFNFSYGGIGVGSNQNLINFTPSQITDSTSILAPILVNISEYGTVGQFVAGSFSGALTKTSPPVTTYNVTCNFRVRRTN